MTPDSTRSGSETPGTSPTARRESVEEYQFDRRTLVRGAGAVLLTGSLAGCYHEDEGDGGDDGEGDGGGDYSVGDPTQDG